jgi:hypothetical protein
MNEGDDYIFKQLFHLCIQTLQEMQRRAGRSVDIYLVIRNWFFGWYVVEYEQNGCDRAEYDAGMIKQTSPFKFRN